METSLRRACISSPRIHHIQPCQRGDLWPTRHISSTGTFLALYAKNKVPIPTKIKITSTKNLQAGRQKLFQCFAAMYFYLLKNYFMNVQT